MENSIERIEAAASIVRALRIMTPNSELFPEVNYKIRMQREIVDLPDFSCDFSVEIWCGNRQFNWQSGTWDFPEAFSNGKPLQ